MSYLYFHRESLERQSLLAEEARKPVQRTVLGGIKLEREVALVECGDGQDSADVEVHACKRQTHMHADVDAQQTDEPEPATCTMLNGRKIG